MDQEIGYLPSIWQTQVGFSIAGGHLASEQVLGGLCLPVCSFPTLYLSNNFLQIRQKIEVRRAQGV